MRFRLILLLAIVLSGVTAGDALALQRQPVPPWREPLPAPRATTELVVGDTVVPVELALSPAEQSLGLGYRNELHAGSGMLFVFDDAAERSFWMKGMRFCLDIIWITADEIVGAAESVCPPPAGTADQDFDSYRSVEPVTHVLEMNAGWLAANGYGPGTPVEIPDPFG